VQLEASEVTFKEVTSLRDAHTAAGKKLEDELNGNIDFVVGKKHERSKKEAERAAVLKQIERVHEHESGVRAALATLQDAYAKALPVCTNFWVSGLLYF
jgi:hypothetical protein